MKYTWMINTTSSLKVIPSITCKTVIQYNTSLTVLFQREFTTGSSDLATKAYNFPSATLS